MITGFLALCVRPSEAQSVVVCDKWASTTGDDANSGTEAEPYLTVQKLVDSLSPGETGCLKTGIYKEADQEIKISRGGTADQRVVLRSAPNERAEIQGRLWVAQGADYVTVKNLVLNGENTLGESTQFSGLPSPTINANYVGFVNNDVTNNDKSICFILGSRKYGTATGTLIRNNRIHNCGLRPATNHGHGIYVKYAEDTKILGNVIYDNADRGIQLYPSAQRTFIQGNIIDGNGEGIIFSGDDGFASSNNTVTNNIISNSVLRWNVESWYPNGNPVGTNNIVQNNCVHADNRSPNKTRRDYYNRNGGIEVPERDEPYLGFIASANLISDPLYVDRDAKDFRLSPNSPCNAVLEIIGRIPQ